MTMLLFGLEQLIEETASGAIFSLVARLHA